MSERAKLLLGFIALLAISAVVGLLTQEFLRRALGLGGRS